MLLFDMLQKRETTINVRTAIEMLKVSWNDIESSTIGGCFRKAGFELQQCTEECEDSADEGPETWSMIQEQFGGCETFWNFVEVDNNIPVAEDLSDESILRMVQENCSVTYESDNEELETAPPPTSGEVMTLLREVRQHVQLWPSSHEALGLVAKIKEAVLKNTVNAAVKQMRYWQVDLWTSLFNTFLNIPSCEECPDVLPFTTMIEEILSNTSRSQDLLMKALWARDLS